MNTASRRAVRGLQTMVPTLRVGWPVRKLRLCFVLASIAGSGTAIGCARPSATVPERESATAQQAIVESAARAFARMRQNPRFAAMNSVLSRAQGVMIFPRLVKASFILGGEGGNGVLMARTADGSWSSPAFYSLGGPSVGLQIGYQEASVVLFIMDQGMLERLLDGELTLGKSVSAALGEMGEKGETQAETFSKPIYQVVEAGGAFVGVSLDGYVIGMRDKHNAAYYGEAATPRAILIDRRFQRAEAEVLRRALAASPDKTSGSTPAAAPPAQSATSAPGPSPSPSDGYRECSPESRQVQVCAEVYAPVCAEVDTGVRCVQAPCSESREKRTLENACRACANQKTYGYRAGPCPTP